ncbi:MAG: LiaF domain-containing protein [Spirochaetaceae bacterium]
MNSLQEYRGIPLEKFRNYVIEQLKLNYAHNNIEVEEFEKRLVMAHDHSDNFELLGLLRDLPEIPGGDEHLADDDGYVQDSVGYTTGSKVQINRDKVRRNDTIAAVLGGTERGGQWRPALHTNVLAVMGGVDLDFRKALFPPEGITVYILAVMGGVDIVVPEGINVEVSGLPLLGGFGNSTEGSHDPHAPTLRIKGVAIMGGVDVETKRSKKKK